MYAASFLLTWLVLPGRILSRAFVGGKGTKSITLNNVNANSATVQPAFFRYDLESNGTTVYSTVSDGITSFEQASAVVRKAFPVVQNFPDGLLSQDIPVGSWEADFAGVRLKVDRLPEGLLLDPPVTYQIVKDSVDALHEEFLVKEQSNADFWQAGCKIPLRDPQLAATAVRVATVTLSYFPLLSEPHRRSVNPSHNVTKTTKISQDPVIQIQNTSTTYLSAPTPFVYRFEDSDLQVNFYRFGKKLDYTFTFNLFEEFTESTGRFDPGSLKRRVPGGRWEEYYGTVRLRIEENVPITRSKPGLTYEALLDTSLVFSTVFPWHKTPSMAQGEYYAMWFSLGLVDDAAGTVQGIAKGHVDQRGPST